MAAYGTRYLGDDKKVYLFCMRYPKEEWRKVDDIIIKIKEVLETVKRNDDSYYFDDDGYSVDSIRDWVEAEDKYIYYRFLCDRETCKQLEKLRKYWGYQVEKTGGRWI